MKDNQRGMTLISFVVLLAIVGFFLYLGMKLFPMYQEYYSVRTSLKGMTSDPQLTSADPNQLRSALFRRLNINASESVKGDNVQIEHIEGGWRMTVSYESRRSLFGNLDVVGKFNAQQDFSSTKP